MKPTIERLVSPAAMVELKYAETAGFHVVTLVTPFAAPEVYRLTVADNAKARLAALRAELIADGYAPLSA